MPYRQVRVITGDKTETVWSRVSDAATMAWLAERPYLRKKGYPDRPPDVDTATVRLWLARPSEERLPYFRRLAHEAPLGGSFPVFTVTWHAPDGSGAKFLLSGLLDGSFVGRLILEDEAGNMTIDKGHHYPPEDDPDDVWDAVTRIVGFVDAAGAPRLGGDHGVGPRRASRHTPHSVLAHGRPRHSHVPHRIGHATRAGHRGRLRRPEPVRLLGR